MPAEREVRFPVRVMADGFVQLDKREIAAWRLINGDGFDIRSGNFLGPYPLDHSAIVDSSNYL